MSNPEHLTAEQNDLCRELRRAAKAIGADNGPDTTSSDWWGEACVKAADEIERLQTLLDRCEPFLKFLAPATQGLLDDINKVST